MLLRNARQLPLRCTTEMTIFDRNKCSAHGAWLHALDRMNAVVTTCRLRRGDPGETKHRGNSQRKTAECVIAAAFDELPCPRIKRHRLAPVEELVAGLNKQKVTFGHRDARHPHRLELRKMALREIVALEGVRICLRSEIGKQIVVWVNGRVDQHGFGGESFGEVASRNSRPASCRPA